MSKISLKEVKQDVKQRKETIVAMGKQKAVEYYQMAKAYVIGQVAAIVSQVKAIAQGIWDMAKAQYQMIKGLYNQAIDLKNKSIETANKIWASLASISLKDVYKNVVDKVDTYINGVPPVEINENIDETIKSLPQINDIPIDKTEKEIQKETRTINPSEKISAITELVQNAETGSEMRENIEKYSSLKESPLLKESIEAIEELKPISECIGAYTLQQFVPDITSYDPKYWNLFPLPIRATLIMKLSKERKRQLIQAYKLINRLMKTNLPNEWYYREERHIPRNENIPYYGLPIGMKEYTNEEAMTYGLDKNLLGDMWWAYLYSNQQTPNEITYRSIDSEFYSKMYENMSKTFGNRLKLLDVYYPINNYVKIENDSYDISIEGNTITVDKKGNKVINPYDDTIKINTPLET